MVDTWDLNTIFKVSNYGYTETDSQLVGQRISMSNLLSDLGSISWSCEEGGWKPFSRVRDP